MLSLEEMAPLKIVIVPETAFAYLWNDIGEFLMAVVRG